MERALSFTATVIVSTIIVFTTSFLFVILTSVIEIIRNPGHDFIVLIWSKTKFSGEMLMYSCAVSITTCLEYYLSSDYKRLPNVINFYVAVVPVVVCLLSVSAYFALPELERGSMGAVAGNNYPQFGGSLVIAATMYYATVRAIILSLEI